VASVLDGEMEGVRELMERYLALLATEPVATPEPAAEPEPAATPEPDAAHVRLNALLARVTMPAGAVLARARETARQAGEARRSRLLVEQSLALLHAGGVGLAQAETYLLRKGQPADVVRAVVAERVRGG
jgi:hypothetical protein